jgi:hypothetical protein
VSQEQEKDSLRMPERKINTKEVLACWQYPVM